MLQWGQTNPSFHRDFFQVRGAGRIVRKKPLETRERFRKRKVLSVENVHSHLLSRFEAKLDVVGVGVKRIGTVPTMTENRAREFSGSKIR